MPTITDLTALTAVDRADYLPIVDDSADTTKKATITSLGESLGIAGLAGGRLSVVSGNSVGEGSAAGTLYYVPHAHDKIALWDGTNWSPVTFTERSLALSVTSGSVYDVFGYLNAGVLALETLVWTNTTTRATAITQTNGVRHKTGDQTRRYLGTIYATGTDQTSDANAARCVWNNDNRITRKLAASEGTSHTHNSTVRAWNNTTTGTRVEFVMGQQDDRPLVGVWSDFTPGASVTGQVAIQIDASTMPTLPFLASVGTRLASQCLSVPGAGANPIGYHYYQCVEASSGGTTTFSYMGIDGTIRA